MMFNFLQNYKVTPHHHPTLSDDELGKILILYNMYHITQNTFLNDTRLILYKKK